MFCQKKLSAMLISNSGWITAASAFIFPAKSLQGILMTSRESLSLGHTVITHCQGGWKRTNRKFPCGKMCFISSPSSCQSSGRKTIETNYERRWKQPQWALPVPSLMPNFWPQNWNAFPGCDPRAKARGVPSVEMRCGQAGHLSQAEHPSTGIAALLLSCHSLMSALHSWFFLMK